MKIIENHITKDLLKLVPLLEECIFSYTAGSLAEGFGNSTSDIDVYVILNDHPNYENIQKQAKINADKIDYLIGQESSDVVFNFVYKKVRYDVTYMSLKKVNKVLKRIEEIDYNSDEKIISLSSYEKDWIHRLKYSQNLTVDSVFNKFKEKIDFKKFNYFMASFESDGYSSILEDLQGAYSSRDYGTAYFLVKKLSDVALNAYLAINGETNPSFKWTYRKLQRYLENGGEVSIAEKYMLIHGTTFDSDKINDFLRIGVSFCQEVNDLTQSKINQIQYEGAF